MYRYSTIPKGINTISIVSILFHTTTVYSVFLAIGLTIYMRIWVSRNFVQLCTVCLAVYIVSLVVYRESVQHCRLTWMSRYLFRRQNCLSGCADKTLFYPNTRVQQLISNFGSWSILSTLSGDLLGVCCLNIQVRGHPPKKVLLLIALYVGYRKEEGSKKVPFVVTLNFFIFLIIMFAFSVLIDQWFQLCSTCYQNTYQ